MRKVIYGFSVSVDGYIESAAGDAQWAVPSDELHRFFNGLEGGIDTHLYGRRMWEVMSGFWPTAGDDEEPAIAEYARIWQGKTKVVYSRTLESVGEGATLVREVVPDEVRKLKAQPGRNISVAGAELAAAFIEHDLVDEYQLTVFPLILGGGKPMLPALQQPFGLRLTESRAFPEGVMLLRYERVRDGG